VSSPFTGHQVDAARDFWPSSAVGASNEDHRVSDRDPRPVVVGLDDLPETHAALSLAAREADVESLGVELVHISRSGEGGLDHAPTTDLGCAERCVHDLTDGRVAVVSSIRSGPVEEVLVDLSRHASLLVLEHRRMTRLERHRLPSTAVRVAGHVHCRIVSVPCDWSPALAARGCITVGIDAVDGETEGLLEHAFNQAVRDGARLQLVHAWCMSSQYDDAIVDATVEEEWGAGYRHRLDAMLDPHRARHPEVEVEVDVVHQTAPKALVDRSRTSDRLILGRGRLVHPLVDRLGSVPRAVLEDSRCPVEVVASPG
jgi:nucleotide-binding universal stress UspA family protein